MKKSIPLFLIGFLLATVCFSQSIYDISFNDIDGNRVSLDSFTGKRILFFVAPLADADSSQLKELKSLQGVQADSVVFVAIMSNEDGYSSANIQSIKSLYQTRNIKVLLTEGMYTRKTSGASQSSLLQWLTNKTQNNRSNQDSQGIGQKFFVSQSGKLNGALPPAVHFLDPFTWRMLNKEQ